MTALPEVAVVGCGKVGGSLAIQLRRLGWPIRGLASRRLASARALADELGVPLATQIPWEATRRADVVVIATPDGAIQPVCETIAGNGGFTPGSVVFHCSGAHASDILAGAANAGAMAGSLHPLQSFAAIVRDRNPFAGIIMAIEGSPGAVDMGNRIAAALGSRPLTVKTEGKSVYHAAAVVASNYLVSLVDIAEEMLAAAGIAPADAFSVLSPLIAGTLDNIAARGTTGALTGPIVRGDTETLERHLTALGSALPHLIPVYRSLGRQALEISRRRGGLSADLISTLERLLSNDPHPGSTQ